MHTSVSNSVYWWHPWLLLIYFLYYIFLHIYKKKHHIDIINRSTYTNFTMGILYTVCYKLIISSSTQRMYKFENYSIYGLAGNMWQYYIRQFMSYITFPYQMISLFFSKKCKHSYNQIHLLEKQHFYEISSYLVLFIFSSSKHQPVMLHQVCKIYQFKDVLMANKSSTC